MNRIFDNIYLLVIGKLFSAADLGYFTRAKNIQALPSETLSVMVGRVTFPVFSKMQDDPVRLKRNFKKALTFLVFLNFPMMTGLALTARPLVLIVLTEKWLECVPYLQMLCLVGFLFPLQLINLNVMQALGRSDLFLKVEIIKKSLIVVNILITWRWGISAMIFGMMVTSIISYYVNSYYSGRLVRYGIWAQLSDLFPYLAVAGLMGSSVYVVGMIPYGSNLLLLLAQVSTGIAGYCLFCWAFRLSAFTELIGIGLEKLKDFRG